MFQSAPSPRFRKTVGIDLGTTNSVIALLDATDSTLLAGQDERGRATLPSAVGYHPEQARLLVGREALAGEGPPAVSSIKRFMGLEKPLAVGPRTFSPPEASAEVLRRLRDLLADTLRASGAPAPLLDSAVITMPAYFNHDQIEATRRAGALAGFEVVELLHEPTAAAIYYSWLLDHGDATYLVYDLGGGTFDVSVIRRRLGDYEVLGVSGDPFLGGDDFDRLLASHLVEAGRWRWSDGTALAGAEVAALFDLDTPEGAVNFRRLVRAAEGIKCALTDEEAVERYAPGLLTGEGGRELSLEARVARADLHRLIKDKVDRTIDCCHEALARARERQPGLGLSAIDHVILVGGSSRLPLVRETVRAALCNPELPQHVRNHAEPLLHEPDLCVAYGAALRAATYGTRYLFPQPGGELALHFTSPAGTRDLCYLATGSVRRDGGGAIDGGSVRIRSLASGLIEEAFLDAEGTFAQEVELEPETDTPLEFTVCDEAGDELARTLITVRHRQAGRPLGESVLPTQLITKPLAIEVWARGASGAGRRVKQVLAPVGATLPNTFRCTCRTADQSGRVVVPIFEENRVIKQMVIEGLDPTLPVGSPVEVEAAIDVKHTIEVRVRIPRGREGEDHTESIVLSPPPPPRRPTRAEIEECLGKVRGLLAGLAGGARTRSAARADRLERDLLEALRYDDEPKAIQRMAELLDLRGRLESGDGLDRGLQPPLPEFAHLVRACLDRAAEVADRLGRSPRERQELFAYIHAQERYAEQAYTDWDEGLYRECHENLLRYGGYLEQLLQDSLPRPLSRPDVPPEQEAKAAAEQFRAYLAAVWKRARSAAAAALEQRLAEIARQAGGLSQRIKDDPAGVVREARRLSTEVGKVEAELARPALPPGEAGLLEGTS